MRIALAIPISCLLIACSGALLTSGSGAEARYRHRELGYSIAYPSVLSEPGWKTEHLDHADLLVRNEDRSLWALSSTCRTTSAGIRLLADELARATGGPARERPITFRHAGLEGVSQRLEGEVEGDGQPPEIKTVTLRGARCTYDWILVAPSQRRLEQLEGPFDDWWRSFQPGPKELVEPDPDSDAQDLQPAGVEE